MDMATLLEQMRREGIFEEFRTNSAAQFGPPQRRLIGATLLPERLVEANSFTEQQIQYRTVVANDATRYSPTQRKGGKLVGEFDVKLAEQDIADEFSSRDYDALRRLLAQNATMEGMAQLTRWFDTAIVRSLTEKNEKQRWEAIVDASVPLRGDNSYREDVAYSNPSGHRASLVTPFTDDTVDPLIAIFERASVLAGKGYTVNRIFAGTPVIQKILNNAKFKSRTGTIIVAAGGAFEQNQGAGSFAALNQVLVSEGLPAIERYDLQYRTMTGTQFFLKRDVMVFAATTGRDEAIDRGDVFETIPNTLGYHAIGVPAGQDNPGRVVRAEAFENKPPRIEGEGWQTALPVIMEPEAIAVLKDIT
jgi:hypothetical protein